jgi:predicted metal-dependent TIM-barrel fold hydrolase
MYMAGIRTLASPIFLVSEKPVRNDVILELWDYLMNFELSRCQKQFIELYGMIGISMVYTPRNNVEELYKTLESYLSNPRVVCIGEIGIEPASKTCPDLDEQEEFVRRQVQIAQKHNVCLDFHIPLPPDQKKKYTGKCLSICEEYGFPLDKVAIDHCSEANLGIALEAGGYAAITVQPWREITPESAAELVISHIDRFGPDRIMIDSDCGGGPSDPLAVAKTALALRRKGVADEVIDRVCSTNSKTFYGI